MRRLRNFIARAAPHFAIVTPVPGKIRWDELQFLHSYPDVLDLDLTLSAPCDPRSGRFLLSQQQTPE
jgi:hypothetical protein